MIVKDDRDVIQSYFEDASNLIGGHAERVVIFESLDELSGFLREASAKKIPVTVSGGGTGTTGARIPFGGVVISMEKFNKIIEVKEDASGSGRAIVQSGVLVEDLKGAADDKGLFYTCHPTEKTACIGGTVATNASGARSFKYGSTRKHIKRLKVVLSNGAVLEIVRGDKALTRRDSRLRLSNGADIAIPLPTYRMPDVKNSAGYFVKDNMDLIDLFIGQEGTLSVVVEAEMELVRKPEKIFACFVFFKSEEGAWMFSQEARFAARAEMPKTRHGHIDPLAIEYFDHNALEMIRSRRPDIPKGSTSSIFFEQEMTKDSEDRVIETWEGLISKHGVSLDETWVAMSDKVHEEFVELRHSIPEVVNEAITRRGFQKLSTDIAVPHGNFLDMMHFYKSTFEAKPMRHVVFGHIGECHVHMNILPESASEAETAREMCLEFARKGVALGGTVSAEHGIGKIKHRYLEELYGKEGILQMARVKKAIDPACILGLNNIFPKEVLDSV